MIQDIYPHKLDNQFNCSAVPEPDSLLFLFRRGDALICENEGSFDVSLFRDMSFTADQLLYLFSLDGTGCYTLKPDVNLEEKDVPEEYIFASMKSFYRRYHQPKELCFALMTAWQLRNWYAGNQYCGFCGSRMRPSEKERALICTECGRTVYPKIVPAVIVAVTNGESLLLTAYANRPEINYALIAGFTEIGETFEETVAREVYEEAGVRVRNIRYYGSQPWGIVDDILAGFVCEVDGDPTIHMDTQELKLAKWFQRDEIPIKYDDFSLTNDMITAFREGRI